MIGSWIQRASLPEEDEVVAFCESTQASERTCKGENIHFVDGRVSVCSDAAPGCGEPAAVLGSVAPRPAPRLRPAALNAALPLKASIRIAALVIDLSRTLSHGRATNPPNKQPATQISHNDNVSRAKRRSRRLSLAPRTAVMPTPAEAAAAAAGEVGDEEDGLDGGEPRPQASAGFFEFKAGAEFGVSCVGRYLCLDMGGDRQQNVAYGSHGQSDNTRAGARNGGGLSQGQGDRDTPTAFIHLRLCGKQLKNMDGFFGKHRALPCSV